MKPTLILATALALSGCGLGDYINTTRAYNYLFIPHFSSGPDSDETFDVAVPGIAVGSEAPTALPSISVGVEAGYYRDPVRDESLYALGFVERDVFAKDKPRGLRVGLFGGVSEFIPPGEDGWLGDDVALTGGVQVSLTTVGQHELRLRISPAFGENDVAFMVGSTFKF